MPSPKFVDRRLYVSCFLFQTCPRRGLAILRAGAAPGRGSIVSSALHLHADDCRTSAFLYITGGNLKYILCVNTDLCYTQTYNGRKKRLVICVGQPAVMPKSIPQTCTDLCFAQICRIQNRIRQICAKRRLDTQIFFYRSSTAKIPVELQTGRLLSNSS